MKPMNFFLLSLLVSILSFPLTSYADGLTTVKIFIKTLACDGSKGLASVDADSVVKLETVKCDANNDPVKEVYQLLIAGEPGSGLKYRVYTMSEEEAEKLMKGVEAFQEDKRKFIRDGNRFILETAP